MAGYMLANLPGQPVKRTRVLDLPNKPQPANLQAPATTEILKPIWQRLLRISTVGVDDNFFELGGDPSSAVRLASEITNIAGRQFRPEMLYTASTINLLAELLESPDPFRLAPLIPLTIGSEEPPVFVTHGLGGSIMELFHIIKHVRSRHPIYGLQARGLDDLDRPFEHVEEIADSHLETIKKRQAHGPYHLIGDSFGGLVMLEVARRLSEDGERVGFVVLLDSYPDTRYMFLSQQLRLFAWRVGRRILKSLGIKVPESVTPDRADGVWFPVPTARMVDSGFRALASYRPRPYSGTVKFVKAATRTVFPANPRAVWDHLVDKLEVETVPGHHLELLTTLAEPLAEVLSGYIADAFPPHIHRGEKVDQVGMSR